VTLYAQFVTAVVESGGPVLRTSNRITLRIP
jgi:hypothetical protein